MAFTMIYDLLPTVLNMKEGEVDVKEHDVLKAFVERLKALEKTADWIKRRPQTTFWKAMERMRLLQVFRRRSDRDFDMTVKLQTIVNNWNISLVGHES